jgi:hypothetical protein
MLFRHFRLALLFVGLVLAVLFATVPQACAQRDGPDRDVYQQKAGMIFAFLKQTKWPGRKMPGPNVPFVVGIYGPDRVSAYLEEIVAGQTVNGRAVMIKRVSAKEELGLCHVIYVSDTDPARVSTALREAHRENVLTVGETANFNASGGVIQFSDEGGRVGYVADNVNAKRERLELGGFLLKSSGGQVKASPPSPPVPPRKSSSATAEDDEDKAHLARIAEMLRESGKR